MGSAVWDSEPNITLEAEKRFGSAFRHECANLINLDRWRAAMGTSVTVTSLGPASADFGTQVNGDTSRMAWPEPTWERMAPSRFYTQTSWRLSIESSPRRPRLSMTSCQDEAEAS